MGRYSGSQAGGVQRYLGKLIKSLRVLPEVVKLKHS